MTTISAYVSIVKGNRTIELPQNIPIGAKVAVIVLPSEDIKEESVIRTMRFQMVMDAIRAAISSNFESPEISDQELNDLIHEARQAAKV